MMQQRRQKQKQQQRTWRRRQQQQHSFIMMMVALLCSSTATTTTTTCAAAFVTSPGYCLGRTSGISRTKVMKPLFQDVLDAEFERVDPEGDNSNDMISNDDHEEYGFQKKSPFKKLLDASLDMDPRWKEARIPFMDEKDRVVDSKLAFTIELDGVLYGIGVPHDDVVLICIEDTKSVDTNDLLGADCDDESNLVVVNPDDDDNQELMEIMAGALQKFVSDDLKLIRTPRILTVEGNKLENYTKNWQFDIFGQVNPDDIDLDDLTKDIKIKSNNKATHDADDDVDDDDEDMQEFFDFIKQEIGEEGFDKIMAEAKAGEENDYEDDEEFQELMKFFELPDWTEEDFAAAAAAAEDDDDAEPTLEQVEKELAEIGINPNRGLGLKLCAFRFKDGKTYSLVQPFEPYTVVGKYVNDPNEIVFHLLTPEEEQIIIPRLQEVAQTDLEKAGLSLGADATLAKNKKNRKLP